MAMSPSACHLRCASYRHAVDLYDMCHEEVSERLRHFERSTALEIERGAALLCV